MNDPRAVLDPALIERLYAHALDFVDESRRLIQAAQRAGFEVSRKSDGSYVTNIDVEVEQRLRALIERHYPEHGVVGEEQPAHNPGAAFQWILDPIDGTEDFVHHVPTFGTIVALHYHGSPIVGVLDHPALDLRASAAFGRGSYRNGVRVRLADADPAPAQARVVLSARANFTRYREEGAKFDRLARAFSNHRIYRSCLGHALVATGAVDAMVDYQDRLWDIAAVEVLVAEAGGVFRVVDEFAAPDGGRLYSTVFGKPAVVARLLALLRE